MCHPFDRSSSRLAMVLVLTAPLMVHAQTDAEATTAEQRRDVARQLGSEGLRALDAGDYQSAVDQFTRAIALYDAPTLRLYRARAFGHVGRWVAACEDYDALLRSTTAAGESPIAAEARDAATQESVEAYARTAKLRLDYAGLSPLAVRIDGSNWPARQFRTPRALDPGDHVLAIERRQGGPLRVALKLKEGESVSFSLDKLVVEAHAGAAARAASGLAAGDADHDVTAAQRSRARRDEIFRIDFAAYGSMSKKRNVDGVAAGFADSEFDSNCVAAMLFPLPGQWRDWVGLVASWELAYRDDLYREMLAGLRVRHAVGLVDLGLQLVAGELRSSAGNPDVEYRLLQPSMDARLWIGELALSGGLGLALPLGYSESLKTAHPDVSIWGGLVTFGAEYRLWPSIGLQLAGSLRRSEVDLGIVPVNREGASFEERLGSFAQITFEDVDFAAHLNVSLNL